MPPDLTLHPRVFRHRRAGARTPAWPLRGPSSVFAKGIHDSRRAFLVAGIGLGLFLAAYAFSFTTNYATVAGRAEAVASLTAVSGVGDMTGPPINPTRLGGFLSWRIANFMPLLLGAWSIVALSGTLAGEIRAGSFEMLAAVPLPRRRIALEKIAVHVAGLGIAVCLIAGLTWLGALLCARLPGDEIAFPDAVVQFGAMALCGLAGGAIAFAMAPWLGRAAAAGIGAVALVLAYLAFAYGGSGSAFEAVKGLSWLVWTESERPIAGSWDNASLLPVAALTAVFLAIGVVGFERRDVGGTIRMPRLTLPGRGFLLRGPARATFLAGSRAAVVWGVALALLAWLLAASAPGYVDQFASDPESKKLMDTLFPGADWRSTGWMLQFMFFDLAVPFMGLAAAVLVHGVASDERERRLDLLLSTTVARVRWLLASGAGIFAALVLLAIIVGAGVVAGVRASGGDPVPPFAGVLVAALYCAALAGIGLAVFGLGRPGLAATTTAALAVGFTLLEVVGGSLRLPAWIVDLSLSRHVGQPMAGTYDPAGMAFLAALTAGALLLGAWGLARRDVSA